jgi:predicted negative regulator of RcsB-dependent stress response
MESNAAELPLHDQLWAWFETHKNQVMWGAGVVVVVGLGIGFFSWQQKEKQIRANEALSATLNGIGSGADRSRASETLLRVAAENAGTAAGGRAVLLAAAELFTEGKYPESRAQFERYLREYRQTPFGGQALLGVAACLDAQGKTNEAVNAYNEIVQRHSSENVALQARLSLARLYEAQNRLEQARDLLLELARAQVPNSMITREAILRLEELIAQHPSLAPARPAMNVLPPANLPKP